MSEQAEATRIVELEAKNEFLEREVRQLTQHVQLLLNRLYGKKSEQINPDQLRLFADGATEEVPEQEPAPQAAPAPRKKKKKGHGRAGFPAHLPRERIELDVPEDDRNCACCDLPLRRIGEDVCERGHVVPSRFIVHQYVRPKYACKDGHEVRMADIPPAVIPKNKFEPSVYAHLAVSKYGDHLPLNRLEGIFKRQGLLFPRQTMWDMLRRIDELAASKIVDAMRLEILESSVIKADETPIQVIIEGQKGSKTGYIWVYRTKKKVIFDFTLSRGRDGPRRVLGKWKGVLQIDGYSGYDEVCRRNGITRAGCWAHVRRKFKDALDSSSKDAARVLLVLRRLFALESTMRKRADRLELDDAAFVALRTEVRARRSRKTIEQLDELLRELHQRRGILPKGPLGKAITYASNQWTTLVQFLDDGEIDLDNNDAERALRQIALGRKNWMFAGSPRGGQCAANLYSLVATCRVLDINPEAYIEGVLTTLITEPHTDFADLTPWAWANDRVRSH